MIMNKTKNPLNSGYQPKTMNNSKQYFAGNGRFSYTRSQMVVRSSISAYFDFLGLGIAN